MAIAELTVDEYKEKQKDAERKEAKRISEINLKTKCEYCDDFHAYSQQECFEKLTIYPTILYIETTVPEIGSWSDPHANWFCYGERREWQKENTTESYRKQYSDLTWNRDENGRHQDCIYSLKKNLVTVYITVGTEECKKTRKKYEGEQIKVILSLSDEEINKIEKEYTWERKRPVSGFLASTIHWLLTDPNEYMHTGNKFLGNTRFFKKLNKEILNDMDTWYWQVLVENDTLLCRKQKFYKTSNHEIIEPSFLTKKSKEMIETLKTIEKDEEKEPWENDVEYWCDIQNELDHVMNWSASDEMLPLDHVLSEGKNLKVYHEYSDWMSEDFNFKATAIAKNGTIGEVWRAIDEAHRKYISRFGHCDHVFIEDVSISGDSIYYSTGS